MQRFEGGKSRNFTAGEKVPNDGRLCVVIANDQSTSPTFTDIVDGNKGYSVLVKRKSALNGQCVVVQAQDYRALRKKE